MKRSVLGVATPRLLPRITAWKRRLIVSPNRLETATERCSGCSTRPSDRDLNETPPPGTIARTLVLASIAVLATGSTRSGPWATATTWPSRMRSRTAISESRVSISQPPARLSVSLPTGTSMKTSNRSPRRTPGGINPLAQTNEVEGEARSLLGSTTLRAWMSFISAVRWGLGGGSLPVLGRLVTSAAASTRCGNTPQAVA